MLRKMIVGLVGMLSLATALAFVVPALAEPPTCPTGFLPESGGAPFDRNGNGIVCRRDPPGKAICYIDEACLVDDIAPGRP